MRTLFRISATNTTVNLKNKIKIAKRNRRENPDY